MDYLERLLTEWYEYQGYFVYRDLWVGLQSDGSYECELNVVGYHPQKNRVIHAEPTMDIIDWESRKQHFQDKFDAGRKYLHRMFNVNPTPNIEQIALVAFPGQPRHTIAGAQVIPLNSLVADILSKLRRYNIASYVIPDQWPLLKTFQFVAEYRDTVCEMLSKEHIPR